MTAVRPHPLPPLAPQFVAARTIALRGSDGVTLSYAELDRRVDVAAAGFALAGVSAGEAVAVWGQNSADWVIAALAAWRMGAVLLPLAPRWTAAEVEVVLGQVGVRWLLVDEERRIASQGLNVPLNVGLLAEHCFYDRAQPLAPDRFVPDCAVLVPTSGTTGRPKLAMLSAQGLDFTARLTADALGLTPGDVYWVPMPLHHVGGLGAVWRTLRSGATLSLARPGRWENWLGDWREWGVTHVSLVPTQLRDALDALGGRPWPQNVRAVMVGGAAADVSLLAACPGAWVTYGLTEAGGTVTLSPAHDADGTAGGPLPGIHLGVLEDDGERVLSEGTGEIVVRGANLMLGYWGSAPDLTDALRGGWLRTGDIGALSTDGRLTVFSRRSDLIVTGGENVYPAEVEAALTAHPDIQEAVVLAVPDVRWGQKVVAAIQIRAGAKMPGLEGVREWLGPRLAGFKHPRELYSVGRFPRLNSGKIDRVGVGMLVRIAADHRKGV